MNARIFVAREADEPDLARLLRFERSLEPAFIEDPIRIVVVDNLVKLPEVEMVRPEPAQALFQALQRAFVIALSILRHQKNLVAPPIHGQGLAHAQF